MDLFKKCQDFTLVKEIQSMGIYPYFHALESRQDVEVIMEGKRRIMLGSNNYLGLTTDPDIVAAGIAAFERYGSCLLYTSCPQSSDAGTGCGHPPSGRRRNSPAPKPDPAAYPG